MTTNTKSYRRGTATALAVLVVMLSGAGCGRGLLGISSTEAPDAGFDVLTAYPDMCLPGHPASCNDTCLQAGRVLRDNCAVCHAQGSASLGLPVFDSVLDPQLLLTSTWTRQGSIERFVTPGDPEHSAIYERAVVLQDMPPFSSDIAVVSFPRVSAADGQILRDWIAGCLPVPDAGQLIDAAPAVDAATDTGPAQSGLATCPASAPSGACAIEQQSCSYPTTSCICAHGAWSCLACPAAQPAQADYCPRPGDGTEPHAVRCRYGAATCSCLDLGIPYTSWECGICPAGEPSNGVACGNATFACDYGDDTCECLGNGWSCTTRTCPMPGHLQSGCHGGYACVYPSLGQSCSCTGNRWSCSCPSAAPVDGSECSTLDTGGPCDYPERSCSCALSGPTGSWSCLAKCPAAQPTAGSACSSSLSCSYGSHLCYCDGQAWQCP